jgi:hypothetical protein
MKPQFLSHQASSLGQYNDYGTPAVFTCNTYVYAHIQTHEKFYNLKPNVAPYKTGTKEKSKEVI